MPDFISEKVIEDILSADKSILADILSLQPTGLSLVARQKKLPSGRLDLLYLYENELLLVELKADAFRPETVSQINSYLQDLKALQEQHKLIGADIRKVVLVTRCTVVS